MVEEEAPCLEILTQIAAARGHGPSGQSRFQFLFHDLSARALEEGKDEGSDGGADGGTRSAVEIALLGQIF